MLQVDPVQRLLEGIDPSLVNLYESLEENEKEWARRCIMEAAKTGKSLSFDFITQIDYERVPVTIVQFLNDPYYMGEIDVWPRWRKEVVHICDSTNQINEVILGGGIGLGKTFNAMFMMLYKLYELSCLRHPAAYHGLSKNSPIVFGIYNATLKLTDVGVDTLTGLLDSSPYFKENFWYEEQYKEFHFPKNIKIMVGSQAFHVLGHNLFCLAIDEMNFHAETKKQSKSKTLQEKGKVHELVTNTSRRMESRFKMHGRGAGLILHISSTKTSTSYLEIRKREVQGQPGVYIIEGPQWEFHPKDKYPSGKHFRFAVGNKFVQPRCLDTVVDKGFGNYEITKGGPAPKGIQIIDPPVEDYRAFNDDPTGAVRDIAGIATETIDPFFPRAQPVLDMEDPTIIHPFINGMGAKWDNPLILDLERDEEVQDFLDRDELLTVRSSREVPKYMSYSPRYLHCDLGRNGDALGLAMVHPTRAVSKVIHENGEIMHRLELSLAVDFALQIKQELTEIDWEKVRDFILWLRDKNFNIQNVGYDSPASGGEIQYLKKVNIPAQYLSVDRRPNRIGKKAPQLPYHVFKTMLNENRIKGAPNEILRDEMLSLEKNADTEQIDHPPGGSKDVADAVCGAVYLCIQDDLVGTMLTPVQENALTHQEKVLSQVKDMISQRENVRG